MLPKVEVLKYGTLLKIDRLRMCFILIKYGILNCIHFLSSYHNWQMIFMTKLEGTRIMYALSYAGNKETRRYKPPPTKTFDDDEGDLGNLSDGSHKSLEWDYQVNAVYSFS